MYLGLIILLNTYSSLFAAIGGQDGMDVGGTHWMTRSIYRTRHQSLGVPFAIEDVEHTNNNLHSFYK